MGRLRTRVVLRAAPGFIAAALTTIAGCANEESNGLLPKTAAAAPSHQETGKARKKAVLLVSHGSQSPQWRQMLLDFGDDVAPQLLAMPGISAVRSAFMEYGEPSIATQLRALDAEGYDDVILVPLLLTVSSHSFDDIPTIVGLKDDAMTAMRLKSEGVERYQPRAEIHITPLLEFSTLLQSNLPRRIAALSQDPPREGVVLVAYGSEPYNDEWEDFFTKIGRVVREKTGVAEVRHCWCGHIVRYSPKPTSDAIRQTLRTCSRAIVIPVLVARDEYFQERIIATAVKEVDGGERVAYVPDAILPDDSLNEWVASVVRTATEAAPSLGERHP